MNSLDGERIYTGVWRLSEYIYYFAGGPRVRPECGVCKLFVSDDCYDCTVCYFAVYERFHEMSCTPYDAQMEKPLPQQPRCTASRRSFPELTIDEKYAVMSHYTALRNKFTKWLKSNYPEYELKLPYVKNTHLLRTIRK